MKAVHVFVAICFIYFNFGKKVHSLELFEPSKSCLKDVSKCDKEELEYLSIAELHDQIDDDKNGNIDITESKDFVKMSLSSSHGSEKANIFHKTDAQIDKQDLWHIWRESQVSNWTTEEMIVWLSEEVELPQYINIFTNLKINGSSLPRLTGNAYLLNILGISDSIHRKKIMIKAVNAVLFGFNKKYHLSTKWVVFSFSFAGLITMYFFVQIIYSKRYVKNLQKKLDSLGETENQLSELRNKVKEVEESKQKKDMEIQQMEEKYKFEISSKKNHSHDSFCSDREKLIEAQKEIEDLKASLFESQQRINKLTKKMMGCSSSSTDSNEDHLLQSLLQLTHSIEHRYLLEKIAFVDRQSMEFKEMNEKVKKRKSGFMGSFRLIHTNDLDELEKGFTAAKKAYEELIREKNEQESRWTKLEKITGLDLIHCGDTSCINQVIRSSLQNYHEQPSFSASSLCLSTEAIYESNQPHSKESEEDILIRPSHSHKQPISHYGSQEIRPVTHQDSHDSFTCLSLNNSHIVEDDEIQNRTRKEYFEKRKPLLGIGRTRIASLNKFTKKNI